MENTAKRRVFGQLHDKASKRVWTRDVILFNVLGYLLLIAFAIMCVLPFYLVVISSFQSEDVLTRGDRPKFCVNLQNKV